MAQTITIIWSPKSMDLIADLRDFLIEKTDQLIADNYIDNLFDFAEEKLNSNPERHPLCRNSTF